MATALHAPDETLERGAALLAPFVKGFEIDGVLSQRGPHGIIHHVGHGTFIRRCPESQGSMHIGLKVDCRSFRSSHGAYCDAITSKRQYDHT